MTEIRRADPDARRQALVITALAMVGGAVLIVLLQSLLPALEPWFSEDPSQTTRRMRLAIYVIAAVFGIPTLLVSVYVWRLGARIARAGQFPTPDMRLVRDVAVVHGARARWSGRLLQILAVLPLVAVLAFIAVLWRLTAFLEAGTR